MSISISEFLNDTAIKIGLLARSKTAAIEELVDLLVEEHEISLSDRASVIERVLDREKLVSTGMEHGVALPHGAVESVDEIVAAMGISHDGVDFQSIDGKPAHIMILLILPANKYSSSVQTMAGIARVLTHKPLRDGLLTATSPEEIMDIISEEEERQLLSGGG